jgi:hypothetical protein
VQTVNGTYTTTLAAVAGRAEVCAVADNGNKGFNTDLGCKTLTVAVNPVGRVDAVTVTPAGIRVQGWAIDPDTTAPLGVQVYADGRAAGSGVASVNRADVAAAQQLYGAAHGYDITVSWQPHGKVCVTAGNVGLGGNVSLGCARDKDAVSVLTLNLFGAATTFPNDSGTGNVEIPWRARTTGSLPGCRAAAPCRMFLEVTLHPYGWLAAFRHGGVLIAVELGLLAIAVAILAYRRTEHAARVMAAIAVLIPFGFPGWPLNGQVLDLAQAPWPLWPQLVSGFVWAVVLGAMLPHFALVFPKPPALHHPRAVIAGLYAAPLAAHAIYMAITFPIADSRLEKLERVSTAWLTAQLYAPVLIILLMVWSYRRTAGTPDRDRLKLVAAALLAAFAVNIAVVQIPQLAHHEALLPTRYWAAAFLLCPLAVGVAIVRHQLFDITVVLRRSILAAGLLAILAAVYAASVWLIGHPGRSQLPYFIIGTSAALLLPPLYRMLRRRIERRFYGARGHPLEVIGEIVALDAGDDPNEALDRLTVLLAQTLRLPYVAITLNEGTRTLSATHGTPPGRPIQVRLTRGNEDVGHLDLDVGPGREPSAVPTKSSSQQSPHTPRRPCTPPC